MLVAGKLVLYVERGGKTLLSWTCDPEVLGPGGRRTGRGGPGRGPRQAHRRAGRRRRGATTRRWPRRWSPRVSGRPRAAFACAASERAQHQHTVLAVTTRAS